MKLIGEGARTGDLTGESRAIAEPTRMLHAAHRPIHRHGRFGQLFRGGQTWLGIGRDVFSRPRRLPFLHFCSALRSRPPEFADAIGMRRLAESRRLGEECARNRQRRDEVVAHSPVTSIDREAATQLSSGFDLDRKRPATTPSMGCDPGHPQFAVLDIHNLP